MYSNLIRTIVSNVARTIRADDIRASIVNNAGTERIEFKEKILT